MPSCNLFQTPKLFRAIQRQRRRLGQVGLPQSGWVLGFVGSGHSSDSAARFAVFDAFTELLFAEAQRLGRAA